MGRAVFDPGMKPPALLNAARFADCAAVARLLDAGTDPNERGLYGETALMAAAARGAVEIAALLLARGADVNAATDVGNTPLMLAAARGRVDAVRLLLERGARSDHKNKYGLGAADWARWSEHSEAVLTLLNAPVSA